MGDFTEHLKTLYQPGEQQHWSGRRTSPEIGNQYWYQDIHLGDLRSLDVVKSSSIGLLGYVCDEGVKRNFGRAGAKNGPQAIRDKLGKLPIHYSTKSVIDYGDFICLEDDMESCQKAFSNGISKLISKGVFPIGLGGGHDIAYAHFNGIKDALNNKRIGIVNFDAHFDLRPVESQPNSGTPFNQIIHEFKSKGEHIDYFVIGIQQQSNTRQLFEIAQMHQVSFVFNDVCSNAKNELSTLKQKLKEFLGRNDYIYITIDMDGFASTYAPGVSAPSSLGFSPFFVYKVLKFLFETNKVISCDICELNPIYDTNGDTSALAAKLVDFMVAIK